MRHGRGTSLSIFSRRYASFSQSSKIKGSLPRHDPHETALNLVTFMQINAEYARLTSELDCCAWGLAFDWATRRWMDKAEPLSQVVMQDTLNASCIRKKHLGTLRKIGSSRKYKWQRLFPLLYNLHYLPLDISIQQEDKKNKKVKITRTKFHTFISQIIRIS